MPRFTPEMERRILETYDKKPVYLEAATELGISEKGVTSVIERHRKSAKVNVRNAGGSDDTNRTGSGLTRDERKRFYVDLVAGKNPVEIIAKYGFDPDVTEKEYVHFMKLNSSDIHSMQKVVMDSLDEVQNVLIESGLEKEYGIIKSDFESKRELTAQQFAEAVGLLGRTQFQFGLEAFVRGGSGGPKGWVRPGCSACGDPIKGLIFDEHDEEVSATYKSWTHRSCMSRLRPIV